MARKKVHSLMPTNAVIEEAAYAVFDRPGGEDLTRDKFSEEVLGLLRHSGAATEKQIDAFYKHIYGTASARKKSGADAAVVDSDVMPRPKKTIAQRERERRAQERKARLDTALATTRETRRADPYNLASWDTSDTHTSGTKSHHATKKTPAQLDREIEEVLTGAGSSSPFEDAKAEQALIEKEVDAASEALQVFPRGPMGLVTSTPEYRAAKARYQKVFARQREFNAVFTKKFAKELRAERSKRYGRR